MEALPGIFHVTQKSVGVVCPQLFITFSAQHLSSQPYLWHPSILSLFISPFPEVQLRLSLFNSDLLGQTAL